MAAPALEAWIEAARGWRVGQRLRRRCLFGGAEDGLVGEAVAPFFDAATASPGLVRFQAKHASDAPGPMLPASFAHDTVAAWHDALRATRLARLHAPAEVPRLEVSWPFCEGLALRGRSYGLSFALLAVGHALGLRLRAVATGDVSPDGRVRRVGAVAAKAAAVAGALPGICALILPPALGAEARSAFRMAGHEGGVVEAATLGAALDAAFGHEVWRAALRERWRRFAVAKPGEASAALVEACRPVCSWVFDWELVEELAEALPEGPARVYVKHVAARRSKREPANLYPLLDEVLALGRRREARQEILAHVIQSLTDDPRLPVSALREGYEHAAARLPARPEARIVQDAQVLGALGRAAAAAGRLEDARRWCVEAMEEWQIQGDLAEMSRPLCELARVLGLLGDAEGFDARVLPHAEAFRQGRYGATDVSRAYVWVAVGHGLALLGRRDAARDWLASAGAEESRLTLSKELRPRRARWLRRCSDGQLKLSAADLNELGQAEAEREAILMDLHEAIALRDVSLAVAALVAWRAAPERVLLERRLAAVPVRGRVSGPLGDAQQIADAYPY